MLEAYACGILVLSTNVGNAKDAAHPAAHGLILDSDTPENFIHKISYWKNRTDGLREIGLRCRSHIESGWRIEHAMSRWKGRHNEVKRRYLKKMEKEPHSN